ncbi:MAG TPA: T9SS type A sorting domain-containing protein, partial [Bacteroidales bacterium]|nr:T9SS type A sorting domain-containing protein [Bacteroidales bacterium]
YLLWNDSLQWVNSWKEEYLYSPAWKLAVYTYFEWQGNPGQWVLFERKDMQTDNMGNLLLLEVKSLGIIGPHLLENTCQQVFTYDYTYSLNNLTYPTWFMDETVPFNNMLTGRTWYCWNKNQQAWNYGARESMYYSQNKPIGIPETGNAASARVWPNPAATEVHFELNALQLLPATVELMTMTGELVLSQELSEGNTINISHLPSGTYLYNLHNPQSSAKGKLVVQQN